jgi:hypothetical protein
VPLQNFVWGVSGVAQDEAKIGIRMFASRVSEEPLKLAPVITVFQPHLKSLKFCFYIYTLILQRINRLKKVQIRSHKNDTKTN